MDEAKLKALDGVMAQIEKQYGKGAIMRLGQAAGDATVEALPTGCLSLDLAIGIGGLPRGRIIEIYGPESSGKTTVARIIGEIYKDIGLLSSGHVVEVDRFTQKKYILTRPYSPMYISAFSGRKNAENTSTDITFSNESFFQPLEYLGSVTNA